MHWASGSMKSYSMSPLMAPPVPSGRLSSFSKLRWARCSSREFRDSIWTRSGPSARSISRRGLPQPLLDTCSLGLEDLFQPLVDVLHHRVHVVLLKLVLPSVPQLL